MIQTKTMKKVLKYNVVFEEDMNGGYVATVPSLPGCVSEGESFEEAKKNIQEAILLYLEGEDVTQFEQILPDKTFVYQIEVSVP
jgi:predicted RNase H-like HicB family nuclease